MEDVIEQLGIPVKRLNKDLKEAARTLTVDEARFLVDSYYAQQESRKGFYNQLRALTESGEPHSVIAWLAQQSESLENQLKRAMEIWTDQSEIGLWCKSIVGIGPIISAGLLANIDMNKCPTAGHIWSFAGIAGPHQVWNKGEKRPWNADFRSLCAYKIGECFVKTCNKPDSYYGKIYKERKLLEIERNEKFMFADQAKAKLEKFNIDKTTDAYKAYSIGKLPDAHIHARARRKAVKIFLSHYHHVAYKITFNKEPPKPFVIQHMGHVDYLKVPNFEK